MTKAEYIDSLAEIVNDELFITNQTNLLDEEISNNCWTISTELKIIQQLTVNDLVEVFRKIKINRSRQLSACEIEIDLIFYVWFDKQATQLRFNLINSNHDNLPFESDIKLVTSVNDIIADFLRSRHHEGIPLSELHEIDKSNIQEDKSVENNIIYELNVYKELIRK